MATFCTCVLFLINPQSSVSKWVACVKAPPPTRSVSHPSFLYMVCEEKKTSNPIPFPTLKSKWVSEWHLAFQFASAYLSPSHRSMARLSPLRISLVPRPLPSALPLLSLSSSACALNASISSAIFSAACWNCSSMWVFSAKESTSNSMLEVICSIRWRVVWARESALCKCRDCRDWRIVAWDSERRSGDMSCSRAEEDSAMYEGCAFVSLGGLRRASHCWRSACNLYKESYR